MLVVPIVNRMYMSRCWRRRHAKGTGAQLVDQALFQYERFAGFDGQFLDNVVLQNKNGPCKFSRPLCLLSFLNKRMHSRLPGQRAGAQLVRQDAAVRSHAAAPVPCCLC